MPVSRTGLRGRVAGPGPTSVGVRRSARGSGSGGDPAATDPRRRSAATPHRRDGVTRRRRSGAVRRGLRAAAGGWAARVLRCVPDGTGTLAARSPLRLWADGAMAGPAPPRRVLQRRRSGSSAGDGARLRRRGGRSPALCPPQRRDAGRGLRLEPTGGPGNDDGPRESATRYEGGPRESATPCDEGPRGSATRYDDGPRESATHTTKGAGRTRRPSCARWDQRAA